MNSKRNQFNRLSEYQKFVIQRLMKEGKNADQIRCDSDLMREDGTKIQKRTVQIWMQRFNETGSMKAKKNTGRKRILNPAQEQRLVNFIEENNKLSYSEIVSKTNFSGTRKSLNNYALRNKISKLIYL